MRLLSFQQNNKSAVGVRIGDDVVNISEAAPHLPSSIIDILRGGPEALAAVEKVANSAGKAFRVAAAEITHLLPITHPDKNIGLGKNYVKHVIEMGGEPPSFPGMFFRIPDSMTAHNQPIWRPEISDTLDYEGELMVVIGKAGRMIPIEKHWSMSQVTPVTTTVACASTIAFQPRSAQERTFYTPVVSALKL